MRQVCEFSDTKRAERFRNFLRHNGIACEVRDANDPTPSVWVHDEDDLPQAQQHCEDFRQDPDASRFDAPSYRDEPKPHERVRFKPGGGSRARYIDVRTEVFSRGSGGAGQVTVTVIIVCVVLTLMSMAPGFTPFIRSLYFSEYMGRGFPEILQGEVWRLITPIFLHAGWLHLIFNMLWLHQLGGQMENVQGPRFLVFFMLAEAILCNTSQYIISGPLFVGMSGVVYGLLGYIWMMTRYAPTSRYMLQPQIVVFMVIWMLVCLVGLVGNIANTQHVVGFATGTAWGYIASGGLRTALRRARSGYR